MLTQIRSLVRMFQLPKVEDLEMNYLERAYDRNNLEYRQRQIDQGLFRPVRYY